MARHAKKQENLSHNEMKKKNQPIKSSPKTTEMLELADKGIKTVVIATKIVITITLSVQKS